MSPEHSCKEVTLPSGDFLYYLGPDLKEGPLPAFFYFSLSGKDSLCLDPFNQPVAALKDSPLRCFSMTLPMHENPNNYHAAVDQWAEEYQKGHDILSDFLLKVTAALDYLQENNALLDNRIAAGGLSRGGFIATHLAARDKRINTVIGFAPMTKLSTRQGFETISSQYSLDLLNVVPELIDIPLKYYIGNRDVLVGTENCFEFIHALSNESYEKGKRSPPVELSIVPSIGFKGHGTSQEVFLEGAHWIKKNLISS